MAFTEFFITNGSAVANTNGGGPRLGTNDGPIYTTADATVAAGTPTIITDNTGTPWNGCLADDWVCWDTAGVKEFRRIVSILGANATMSAAMTAGANKAANVGGAWAGDLALTFITTSFVNAAGNPPRLNIKGPATYTLTAARTFPAGTITIPITIEGYTSTVGDLAALSWAASHRISGWLDMTNFPTTAGGANTQTFTGFNNFLCLKFTSSKNGDGFYLNTSSTRTTAWRCSFINTNTSASVYVIRVSNGGFNLYDCDCILAGGGGTAYCLSGVGFSYSRITCKAGGGATFAAGAPIGSLIVDIAAGFVGLNNENANGGYGASCCTFDRISGNAIAVPNSAQTYPQTGFFNNILANSGGIINLRTSQVFILFGGNNYIYNVTNPYGSPNYWLGTPLPGDVNAGTGLDTNGLFTLVESGTATGGGANTITLAAGASAVNDYYYGCKVKQTSGAGSGQEHYIISYVGATKVATIGPNWTNNPGAGTTYELYITKPRSQAGCLGMGIPPSLDAGWWNREADFPAVGNVTEDDTVDGAIGVYHEVTAAEVQLGVQFGASGTEYTGTLAAGGGLLLHPGLGGGFRG